MEKKSYITKILALTGTILLWIPILFMAITSIFGSISEGRFLCDYLIPAELFGAVFLGTVLLLWSSLRAKSRVKGIALGVGLMVFFLACVFIVPQMTGLANGDIEPEGWPWVLTLGALALYTLAIIWLGVMGIIFVRGLSGSTEK